MDAIPRARRRGGGGWRHGHAVAAGAAGFTGIAGPTGLSSRSTFSPRAQQSGHTSTELRAALKGCAPSFGQCSSFAISRLRWSRSTYSFRGRFDPVQPVAVRLELVHGLAREFRRGEDGHVMLLTR